MEDNNKGKGLVLVLALTVFLVGFVVGMFVMHYSDSKSYEKSLAEAKAAFEAEHADDGSTKVYVPKREVKYGEVPINSYDQSRFVTCDDGYMAYVDADGNKISYLGADISYHQEKIDWEKLKQTPLDFLMIRCGYRGYTEGNLMEDSKFKEYASAAIDAGYPIGVYFFTQALSEEEAIAEADYTLSLIESFPISYPVAIDTEYVADENARTNLNELSVEERTKCVIAYCERIKENGYYPIIYSSENWLRRNLDASMLQEYEIWAPQYLDTNDFMYDFTIWQYTDKGQLPGIDSAVDLNISMVDYASFVPALREAFTNGGEIIEE